MMGLILPTVYRVYHMSICTDPLSVLYKGISIFSPKLEIKNI